MTPSKFFPLSNLSTEEFIFLFACSRQDTLVQIDIFWKAISSRELRASIGSLSPLEILLLETIEWTYGSISFEFGFPQLFPINKLNCKIDVSLSQINNKKYILTNMQLEKVRKAFENRGFNPNSYITKRQYENVLNSLLRGEPFSDEVSEELWIQASGDRPSQQLRVDQVASTIVDAQNILRSKITQTNDQIASLSKQKRILQNNPTRQSMRQIQELDIQIQDLEQQKQSFQTDYKYVTQPFGIQMFASVYKNMNTNPTDHRDSFVPDHSQTIAANESEDLKILLYLSIAFGLVQLIMIFDKYDFLNLIVVTSLLSIYFLGVFDKLYVRFTLGLMAISIFLDIVWLIMYAGIKWNPPQVGNDSVYETGYLRFIVFFTAALIPLKVAITIYLWRHRNAGIQDKYALTFGTTVLKLNANKSNPISKGISQNLESFKNYNNAN